MSRPALFGSILYLCCTLAQAKPTTVYTDLHGKACQVLESGKKSSTRRCPGTMGYTLLVHENEGRSSLDIVAPGKDVYQLDFYDVVTPGLSSIGRKAEWQLASRAPQALLIRVDTLDDSNPYYPKTGSALAVVRIEADGACVVFRIDAGADRADIEAHEAAADRKRKCLGAWNLKETAAEN